MTIIKIVGERKTIKSCGVVGKIILEKVCQNWRAVNRPEFIRSFIETIMFCQGNIPIERCYFKQRYMRISFDFNVKL